MRAGGLAPTRAGERPGFRLLAITPPAGRVDEGLVETWAPVRALGLAVLLREPGTRPERQLTSAHRFAPLRRACAQERIPCLLSVEADDLPALGPSLRAAGIAGVQLRADPAAPALVRARQRLATGLVLGRSCHGHPEAVGDRADYSVLAPIFAPRTESTTPGPGKRAVGLEPLRAFAAREPRVFALGGITPARVPACRAAGAFGLAAIRCFFGPRAVVADNMAALAIAWAGSDPDAAPPSRAVR